MKVLRNSIVFGSILFILNLVLNFLIYKILELFNLGSWIIENTILASIINGVWNIGSWLILMVITKKFISLKLEISFEDAKKMLLVIFIISLILSIILFIKDYNDSLKVEKELESMIQTTEEAKKMEGYKYKDGKELVDSLYEIYTEAKDEIMELESKKRNSEIILLIFNILKSIICIYIFGLHLFKKEN